MKLEMQKFGKILNSRPAAREAALRAKQIINGSTDLNEIVVDLTSVEILTPSYADEFNKGLKEFYPQTKIIFVGYEQNEVLKDTLKALGII